MDTEPMYASYASIHEWLKKVEADGTLTVLTVDIAWVFGINKQTMAILAKRGEFGAYARDADRFYRVQVSGVRAFLEKYKCAFVGWVSLREARRLSGAKESTLLWWLKSGAIVGGRDMHGRVCINPNSLTAAREYQKWTKLPEELCLDGQSHLSLARLARDLTKGEGIKPNDKEYAHRFWQNYTMFYRWMTKTPLSRYVKRVGRRRALYIPWHIYKELVDVVRPHEAAALVGESSHMMHYWAKKGRISFVQFDGTQKMMSREGLMAFLDSKKASKKSLSQT